MTRNPWILGAAGLGALAIGSAAGAKSIGINFDGPSNNSADQSLAPTQTAGVVPQANWNNGGAASGTLSSLIDSSGATVPGATATYSAVGTWGANPPGPTPSADDILTANYLDVGTGNTGTVTVNNVPYSVYDVYIYTRRNEAGFDGPLDAAHGGNNQTDGGSNYTVNGAFQHVVAGFNVDAGEKDAFPSHIGYRLDPAYTNSPTYLGDGGNYTVFHGVTGSTLNVIANANNGTTDFRTPVDGIEIVDTSSSVPEPASLSFLGLGGGVLLARRRRRA